LEKLLALSSAGEGAAEVDIKQAVAVTAAADITSVHIGNYAAGMGRLLYCL
jgi:hypothetical protein